MSHVGNRIKEARIKADMSQIELANALGLSKGTISRYELSSREPRYSQLCAIADVLNVPVQQLAGPFSDEDDSASTEPAITLNLEERRLKRQEQIILKLFNTLSMKGKAEAVRRLSELSQLPEYRQALTLPHALILYVSQENKADYYVTEDADEKESFFHNVPFGSGHEEISVRHIVLMPVLEDSAPIQHFWVYLTPITDAETMDAILDLHFADDFNDSHLIVLSDKDSCNLAYNRFETHHADDTPDEMPDFIVLCAQEDETGCWTIQEQ